EGALRAEEQLAQVWAGRRRGRPAQLELPGWGDHAQSAHHVVEAPVAGRVLSGRARGGEPADGRVLEALRVMAELEPVLGQQLLRPWPRQARAEHRFAGGGVERFQA